MAEEPEVPHEIEKVSIEPAPEGSEIVEAPEGSEPAEGDEPEAPAEDTPGPKEQLVRPQTPAPAEGGTDSDSVDGIKRLPNETPGEFAMRLELTKTRIELRKARGEELIGKPEGAVAPVAKATTQPNQGRW